MNKAISKINSTVRRRLMSEKPLDKISSKILSSAANIFETRLTIRPASYLFRSLIRKALDRDPCQNLEYYMSELINNETMANQHQVGQSAYGDYKFRSFAHKVNANPGLTALYYALIRELQPNSILETGTAWGSMTSFLLCALHKNGRGRLTSIDLSPVNNDLTMSISIPPEQRGMYIPNAYRYLHTLVDGDAKQILPILIASEGVDFFVHDSLHSSSHMAFEYRCALNLMKKGDIILSDDCQYFNPSFKNFCQEHRLEGFSPLENLNTGICIIKLNPEEEKFAGPCRGLRYNFTQMHISQTAFGA
jgi:hypothetical protein